ncbi:DUF2627 domain-containing protein [Metabacillus sp. RGM 3146]|uniref:DUF2627 domain-containing protein n=1 Tax=Metabacillus sp. RGM 3146 TaxID=3401092 RepID=UPI003B9C25C7
MVRILALCIMLIPGLLAAWGIKLMRDMLFGILNAPFPYLWMQFIGGLVFFVGGLSFVGGFVFYRDRKRSKVQQRFQKNSKRKLSS